MLFNFKNHLNIFLILIYLILLNCQLKETAKNHGIVFLENRSKKLTINKTNKNDVINIIGHPHSKSINDENTWVYLERTLNKGKYYKLEKNYAKYNLLIRLQK